MGIQTQNCTGHAAAGRKLLIVDDERTLVELLRLWLFRLPEALDIRVASSAAQAVQVCREFRPDVAMLDIMLPDRHGLDLAGDLLEDYPTLKVLMFTGRCDPFTVHRASRMNIHGYVDKSSCLEELGTALRAVLRNKTYFSVSYIEVLEQLRSDDPSFDNALSNREVAVLGCVAQGFSDEEIARQMKIMLPTVWTHRHHIRTKLGLHNDRELIRYARQSGVTPDLTQEGLAATRRSEESSRLPAGEDGRHAI